jgi:hypothetical protein
MSEEKANLFDESECLLSMLESAMIAHERDGFDNHPVRLRFLTELVRTFHQRLTVLETAYVIGKTSLSTEGLGNVPGTRDQ